MARDRWGSLGAIGSCESIFPITPNNSNDLGEITRGIYVAVAGDVAVMMIDGSTVTFSAVPAGTILPVRVKRVMSTGTTAGQLLGMA